MARKFSKCPHMDNIIQLSPLELCKIKQGLPCSQCDTSGPNLWLCLHRYCLHTGCSEQANDHSTEHFKINNQHCIHMNLSSQRIWCYLCETEVFLGVRKSLLGVGDGGNTNENEKYLNERLFERTITNNIGDTPESSCGEDDAEGQADGLVGLQNIANTCYMNAALQALSNSPPLTWYFLDCGDIIEASNDNPSSRKVGLAKSYHRLMRDMWLKSKKSGLNYLVPRGILYGIRSIYPMFRGYQQHDTQEFLRCFMDQLHEELKEVTPPPPDNNLVKVVSTNHSHSSTTGDDKSLGHGSSSTTIDDDQISCSTPSASQSEAEEYETCDSGVSEQSSLSDEGTPNLNIRPKNSSKVFGSRPSSPASTSGFSSFTTTGKGSPQHAAKTCDQKNKSSSPLKMPHRSIISDVFDGKLLSSVQCLTCNRVSTREETFQDLSLPIPGKDHLTVLHQGMPSQQIPMPSMSNCPSNNQGSVTCTDAVYQVGQEGWIWWVWNWFRSWFWGPSVTLHDCMAAFFSADELKGDNMYSCDQCNKLRNGIKYSRVLALPEMLCIHLKRFRHDLSYSSKISSPVCFPLTGLDMRPYLHKDCKSEISTYDLTAVICHHGTVGGGHYTSFARNELTGKWYEFDDQSVTEVPPENVQNCQAYVLFYRKSNPIMANIRAEAQEIAERNSHQASDIRFYVSRQWINRFNTFAEPGPIDNWTILCPHGGLPPCKAALIERLAIPLPQPLWDFLYQKFGGGPACNRLFECDTCRRAAESLACRQEAELEAFMKFNHEFQYEEKPITTIYAISMAWFRKWQHFARGLTTEEPGPINNTTIAAISDPKSPGPIRNVKPGSDHASLNTSLWKFFYDIYGGGPEIILRGGPSLEEIRMQREKEKEADLMEIDAEPKSLSGNSILNKSKEESIEKVETDDKNSNEIKQNKASSLAKPKTSIVKQTKNVSFEDENDEMISESCNDSSNNGKNNGSDDEEKNAVNTNSGYLISSGGGRHMKYELKKDKKLRGALKSSSNMFGPEGKYQKQTSIDNPSEQQKDKRTILDIINANGNQNSEESSKNDTTNDSQSNTSFIHTKINHQKTITTTTTTSVISSTVIDSIASPFMKTFTKNSSSLSEEMEPFLSEHNQEHTNNVNNNKNTTEYLINGDTGIIGDGDHESNKNYNSKNNNIEMSLSNKNNNNNNNNNNNSNKPSILSKKYSSGSVGKGHHYRKKLKSKSNKKATYTQSSNQDDDSC